MTSFFTHAFARGGAIVALVLGAVFAQGAAQAGGTDAGTTIGNKATLNYSVGNVNQNPIASSPTGSTNGTGATTTFVVDNKISLTVTTNDGAPVTAVPGQASVTTTFTVSNTGNNTQDYALSVANLTTGAQTIYTVNHNDNFNVALASCSIQVNGVTQSFIGSLAKDASVPVKVVCPVSINQVNNDLAGIYLLARTAVAGTSGGTLVTETSGADNPNAVDVVFADVAGSDDALRDGRSSARSSYKVSTASLQVTKTFSTVCDPYNGSTNPKNIPGAYVQYTVQIKNTGSASATLGQITDALVANVSFDEDLISGSGVGTNCAAGTAPTSGTGKGFRIAFPTSTHSGGLYPKYFTTTSDGDGATHASNAITIDFANALAADAAASYAAGELKVNDIVEVTYQVKIN
jgi:hypothetical protein